MVIGIAFDPLMSGVWLWIEEAMGMKAYDGLIESVIPRFDYRLAGIIFSEVESDDILEIDVRIQVVCGTCFGGMVVVVVMVVIVIVRLIVAVDMI